MMLFRRVFTRKPKKAPELVHVGKVEKTETGFRYTFYNDIHKHRYRLSKLESANSAYLKFRCMSCGQSNRVSRYLWIGMTVPSSVVSGLLPLPVTCYDPELQVHR